MPTFETLRQDADNRALVRKIQKAVAFLAPVTSELPDSLFDGTGALIDLKALGYLPVGMVTPDGYTFTREISKEDISALGYASAVRSDITAVVRTVAFTGLESFKRHMMELKYGTTLSGVVQDATTGEVVFDEPDLPVGQEYRLLVIGSDGPAAENWIVAKGYGRVKLASTGDETWGQEGAVTNQYTLDVFTDDEIGTPVRHYVGGTGAKLHAAATGFNGPTPPDWTPTLAYLVGDRVVLTNGEVLEAEIAGTSDAAEPIAPAVGATVVDGTVTWRRIS